LDYSKRIGACVLVRELPTNYSSQGPLLDLALTARYTSRRTSNPLSADRDIRYYITVLYHGSICVFTDTGWPVWFWFLKLYIFMFFDYFFLSVLATCDNLLPDCFCLQKRIVCKSQIKFLHYVMPITFNTEMMKIPLT